MAATQGMAANIGTDMSNILQQRDDTEAHRLLALLQLSSPALPVGSFSYSQGLEAAVAAGLVNNETDLHRWIEEGLTLGFGRLELPVWALQYRYWRAADTQSALQLDAWFRASRETSELLLETEQMGWSAQALLRDIGISLPWTDSLLSTKPIAYPTVMAALAVCDDLPIASGVTAYCFAWVEAQVMAGSKAIPLGQAACQRLLRASRKQSVQASLNALTMQREDLQTFSPGLAILSSLHETQYTRLFRS
jgi:urease accessory protein